MATIERNNTTGEWRRFYRVSGRVVGSEPVTTQPCGNCHGTGRVTFESLWTANAVTCDDCGGSGDEWITIEENDE